MKKIIISVGIIIMLVWGSLEYTFGASLAQNLSITPADTLFFDGAPLVQTFTPVESGFAKFVGYSLQLDAASTATTTAYIFDTVEPTQGAGEVFQFENLLAIATTSFTNSGALDNSFLATSTFSAPPFLVAGRTYTLAVEINSITGAAPKRFNATTDSAAYLSGSGYYESPGTVWNLLETCGFGCTSPFPQYDFYFDVTDADGGSILPVDDSVPQLLFPTEDVNTADFSNWVGRMATSTGNGTFIVRYSRSTSTWQQSDAIAYNASSTGNDSFYIPKRTSLYPISASSTQVWYAQAMFQTADGTTFGDIVGFNVTGPRDAIGDEPTTPPSFGFCDTGDDGIFTGIAKEIGCILFAPGESSTSFLITAYTDFQNVFPFNLFFNTVDIFYQEVQSPDEGQNLTFSIPLNGTSTVLFHITTTTFSNSAGGFANTVYNFFLMIFIVLFAIAIAMVIFHNGKRA